MADTLSAKNKSLGRKKLQFFARRINIPLLLDIAFSLKSPLPMGVLYYTVS